MPATSATSISRMRANASTRTSSGSSWAMRFSAVTPWKARRRVGSTPNSSLHRAHDRSTDPMESMRVPSMSRRTAAKGSAKTDVRAGVGMGPA